MQTRPNKAQDFAQFMRALFDKRPQSPLNRVNTPPQQGDQSFSIDGNRIVYKIQGFPAKIYIIGFSIQHNELVVNHDATEWIEISDEGLENVHVGSYVFSQRAFIKELYKNL
jgi:hypothetical protein